MKKNKTMRVASVLLIAVLLTTSIISGTFAKYVTTGEASDTARVAKFGVVVEGSGSLFAQNYWWTPSNTPSDHDNAPNPDMGNEALLTVESSNGENLVAPGTKSGDNALSFALTGTPEVDVRITFALEDGYKDVVLKAGKYADLTTSKTGDTFELTEDYYPIKYTLKGAVISSDIAEAIKTSQGVTSPTYGEVVEGRATGSLEQIKNVLNYINTAGGIYVDANTDLSTVMGPDGNNNITLTWEWPFESNHDAADTLLGDFAAGTAKWDNGVVMNQASCNLTVQVALSVTVTQVD